MAFATLRPGETANRHIQLADGRWQLVHYEKVTHNSQLTPAKAQPRGTAFRGIATAEANTSAWAGLLLIDVQFVTDADGATYIERTYEQIHATAETVAGRARISRGPDLRRVVEQDYLQFSSAPATPRRPGSACEVWPVTSGNATGSAATDTLTLAGHGYLDGDKLRFPTLTGGAGLALATDYYVRDATTDTFKLAAAPGGTAIDITTNITAATLLLQVTLALVQDDAPDDGTLRRIKRRWVEVTSAPVFAGWGVLDYPFSKEGDTATAEIRQKYFVLGESYAPPALSQEYDDDANFPSQPTVTTSETFYCVGDGTPQAVEDGSPVVGYERAWTMIPAPRLVPVGSAIFTAPGLPAGTVGSPATITAMTPSEGDASIIVTPTFTTSGPHGFAVGQRVSVRVQYDTYPYDFGAGGVLSILEVPSSTTFKTASFVLFYGTGIDYGSFTTGTATLSERQRAASRKSTAALAFCTYALPGVTPGVDVATDFRTTDEFQPVVTSTGEETDTLSALTTPTAAEYRELVAGGEFLVIEGKVKPYKGLILEMREIRGRAR